MSQARIRNMAWVYDHAFQAASSKAGIMRGLVTVGEVVKSLGFSRNTVQKYFDELVSLGHIEIAIDTKSVKIYAIGELRNVKH